MKRIYKWLIGIGLALVTLLLILIAVVYSRYGGGVEYTDVSTDPVYEAPQLELFFSYPEPIGNVAATPDTGAVQRVFFTVHPESRPENVFLLEIIDGQAVPYPYAGSQKSLFNTVLGVFVDQQNRLWTIDHGMHGSAPVQLLAFDLSRDSLVHRYVFPPAVAEPLSFFNDLTVSPDGRYVFVADVSFFGRTPSLVVYDMVSGRSRSLLDGHQSVDHQGFVPVTPNKKMRFFGGIVDLLTGIDGIDISRDGKYVYWAPMGHPDLFRLETAALIDFSRSDSSIAAGVESMGVKPLSDGIRLDTSGNVYITDIEHQGVFVVQPDGRRYTLIKDERVRWADGLSLGGDGYMYLADSDIPNQMMQSRENIVANAPYNIFRFKTIQNNKEEIQ
jgi:sugar lactone lactonase YvrE